MAPKRNTNNILFTATLRIDVFICWGIAGVSRYSTNPLASLSSDLFRLTTANFDRRHQTRLCLRRLSRRTLLGCFTLRHWRGEIAQFHLWYDSGNSSSGVEAVMSQRLSSPRVCLRGCAFGSSIDSAEATFLHCCSQLFHVLCPDA